METIVEAASTDAAVIVITRIYDAPRALVWTALTDPVHVAEWYGGEGFTSPVCEMDVRPGGLWRHIMRAPNGMEFGIEAVFTEVVEPERLVWTSKATDRPAGAPPVAVNTVTLEDLGGRTRWTLEARFDTLADRDLTVRMGFGHMVSQGAERLAAHLGKM
ncbi:SRPBCC domain-containing protein [Phenylobacterium sp.]|uniref:SRPBCC domain-containing protein n=1 Tax=Phenylobacterium sp. TaxID=1871053 RepID=UPI002FC748D3